METLLRQSVKNGELRALDLHLALWLGRVAGGAQPERLLAAVLTSRASMTGDVCLDLAAAHVRRPISSLASLYPSTLEEWRASLRDWAAIGAPGSHTPLVLDAADRLYLGRFWAYEHAVAERIRALAHAWVDDIDHDVLRAGLFRHFPQKADSGIDWQRIAAAVAVLKRFAVIAGGPGTGKTHTVAAVLALLLEQFAFSGRVFRCALTAPTGKAAARLTDAIRAAKHRLQLAPELAARLPEEAQTIHRLLGTRTDKIRPRYHEEHPLNIDALIVDEASMLDLPLMAHLLAALPLDARLILLGDRDQLASVEAGMVLGDVFGRGKKRLYSTRLRQALTNLGIDLPRNATSAATSALADSIVSLRHSHRFDARGGIGALAAAINAGDSRSAIAALTNGAPTVRHLEIDETALRQHLMDEWVPRYRACLESTTPAAALAEFGRARILCALRQGPWGVVALNELMTTLLTEAGLLKPAGRAFYAGRAVIVVANDEATKLYNGDVGLLLPDAARGGALRAFFTADEGIRRVLPARLPAVETAFAMTVHKAQGSEFDEVWLLLPHEPSAVLTRELIYTGITRARARVTVIAPTERIAAATALRTRRTSGLFDALWRTNRE